jgi:hypothetical protein
MPNPVVVVSVVIKVFAIIMMLYAFHALSPVEEQKRTTMFARYFLAKRKCDLLRQSLLFVAVLAVIELGSMCYDLTVRPEHIDGIRLLLSDIVFLGLLFLLSKIYHLRSTLLNQIRLPA